MGALAFRQVQAQATPSHDEVVNALVEKVGRRIAVAAEAPPPNTWKAPHYDWEFEVVDRRAVNASCLPGGKVIVYTGLLPITRSEAGLATVIGHEVAHALARHAAERLSDRKAAAIAIALAGVGLAMNQRTSSVAPLAMAALGAGAMYGVLLPMSRTQESEADHIGLVLMALRDTTRTKQSGCGSACAHSTAAIGRQPGSAPIRRPSSGWPISGLGSRRR
ncbi:MAG TPA: M48 family metallopeptidase [Reyranella sp.]|nr:M48 family metallopeptidase [Reyranella sp.]